MNFNMIINKEPTWTLIHSYILIKKKSIVQTQHVVGIS
jgi:hypothetical protein